MPPWKLRTTETPTRGILALQGGEDVKLSGGFSAQYSVAMNDVDLVSGSRDSLSIPSGQSTVRLRSTLDNSRLVPWWVAFVQANETVHMRATGSAEVSALVNKRISFPAVERTALAGRTPIIDAFSSGIATMEGEYTASTRLASAGYEIRDARARWGEITRPTSNMTVILRIHNPGDVPVPLVPDGFQLNAEANDVPLFTAGRDALTPQNVGPNAMLAPGETRTVRYTVSMTNSKVDEWFVSHVQNGEVTDLVIKPRLRFAVPDTDLSITVPQGGAGYQCTLRTGILVDGQQTQTDCGSGGSVGT